MKPPVRSEAVALKVSRRDLIIPGWRPGRIAEAVEKTDKRGNPMFELLVTVTDEDGNERQLRDFLTSYDFGALKMRHAIEAVGALDRYEAGEEIMQDLFPGHDVLVKIGVQKGTRNFPGEHNIIEDFRAATAAPVVSLRPAS
jgi:hypothetical protein